MIGNNDFITKNKDNENNTKINKGIGNSSPNRLRTYSSSETYIPVDMNSIWYLDAQGQPIGVKKTIAEEEHYTSDLRPDEGSDNITVVFSNSTRIMKDTSAKMGYQSVEDCVGLGLYTKKDAYRFAEFIRGSKDIYFYHVYQLIK